MTLRKIMAYSKKVWRIRWQSTLANLKDVYVDALFRSPNLNDVSEHCQIDGFEAKNGISNHLKSKDTTT